MALHLFVCFVCLFVFTLHQDHSAQHLTLVWGGHHGSLKRERDNVVYWKTKRKIKNDLLKNIGLFCIIQVSLVELFYKSDLHF